MNMRRHLVSEIKVDSDSPLRLSYGFIMDGVRPLQNITKIAHYLAVVPHSNVIEDDSSSSRPRRRGVRSPGSVSLVPSYLVVYPDPELDSFIGVKRFYFTKNEYLNLHVRLDFFHTYLLNVLARCNHVYNT